MSVTVARDGVNFPAEPHGRHDDGLAILTFCRDQRRFHDRFPVHDFGEGNGSKHRLWPDCARGRRLRYDGATSTLLKPLDVELARARCWVAGRASLIEKHSPG